MSLLSVPIRNMLLEVNHRYISFHSLSSKTMLKNLIYNKIIKKSRDLSTEEFTVNQMGAFFWGRKDHVWDPSETFDSDIDRTPNLVIKIKRHS